VDPSIIQEVVRELRIQYYTNVQQYNFAETSALFVHQNILVESNLRQRVTFHSPEFVNGSIIDTDDY
jgi:hypothetical protein